MNRIAELRKENGLSQQQLAQKLHVHQTAVSQWETERTEPSLTAVFDMCALFDVQADYLLGRNNERSRFYVDPDDKLISEYARAFKILPTEAMPADLSAIKSVMNISAYDLARVNGEYYLSGQNGSYMLSAKQVQELRNSSVQYIEYLCAKLEKELSGFARGTIHFPDNDPTDP